MANPVFTRIVQATTHGRAVVRIAAGIPRGLIFGFHGYAETAEIQLQRLTEIPGADDWTLVSVQGLHHFYRGRSQDVVASWMTRQDRDLAIADNIRYVDAVVEAVTETEPLPIVHVGFSQGVAMAFRAAIRGYAGSAGVIAAGGDVPPDLLEDSRSWFPPALLMRGARDEWYTQAKLDADFGALRPRCTEVRKVVLEAGHEWTADAAREAGLWLTSLPFARGAAGPPRPNGTR
jgi:predicted esterase